MKVSAGASLLIAFFVLLWLFSLWLMFHTFSIDRLSGDLQISTKVYSDFGAHIPLIRSFSQGSNWPPVHPLFPGEPIKYHFLFYLVVGLLEKMGIRLDLALNLLSAAGFFGLCSMIFIVGRRFFGSVSVGVLSVLFFLFNGSFSFIDFISSHPFSPHFLSDLVNNTTFPAFAPWNESLISAFWNLNIYTNQRHLAMSFSITLLIVYLLNYRPNLKFISGFLLGSLLLINQAAFLIAVIFCFHHLIYRRPSLGSLMWISTGFVPWLLLYFRLMSPLSSLPDLDPGYLIPSGTSFGGTLHYWLLNLGLHLLLIPLGIFFAPSQLRHYWFPVLLIFILPNVFRFSPDMVNNHKLFNFFLFFGAIFSAGLIHRLWTQIRWSRFAIVAFTPLLFLGGIVDLFPIINDYSIRIPDLRHNPDITYIQSNTPAGSVFLNDTWFYHQASLAGRYIFNGYPYFTWSYGYDNITREQITVQIYGSPTAKVACQLLQKNGIDYVQAGSHPEGFLKSVNRSWLSPISPEYTNPLTGIAIYSVADICLASNIP